MANNINFGEIYKNTYWGIGVTSNSISWGKSYLDIAQTLSALELRYIDRVEADDGVIEAEECLTTDYSIYDWDYYYRVTDDSGVVESLECVTVL